MFWLMALVGWPFFLWQLLCLWQGWPVMLLGRSIGVRPVDTVKAGVRDMGATEQVLIMLALEFAVFAGITIYAYMQSYYRRGG